MTWAVVGLIISAASTMVVSRLLIDRSELQSDYGRVMIAITLVEDVAVVVLNDPHAGAGESTLVTC